uniref:NAD(P)-binding protein n=1 Tax=Steinernema glaseri TaxID=37863 RepID=A0A1I7Z0B6_9BILA
MCFRYLQYQNCTTCCASIPNSNVRLIKGCLRVDVNIDAIFSVDVLSRSRFQVSSPSLCSLRTMCDRKFAGKVVIVTGSSSGIGQGVALLFGQQGANVTIHGLDLDEVKVRLSSSATSPTT